MDTTKQDLILFEDSLDDLEFVSESNDYIDLTASKSFLSKMEAFSKGVCTSGQFGANVWLAGGAILDILNDEAPADFDVFGVDEAHLTEFCFWLENQVGADCVYTSPDVQTYKLGPIKFQVVFRSHRLLPDPFACIDEFPFHINQYAFDGTKIYCTKAAAVDRLNETLTSNKIHSANALEALIRLNRYGQKGFKVTKKTVMTIGDTLREMTEDEYQHQIEYVNKIGLNGGY